jgi:hypothetical protein
MRDGKVLLFRFYDPRVLSIHPADLCARTDQGNVRPRHALLVESSDAAAIAQYSHAAGMLRYRLLPL